MYNIYGIGLIIDVHTYVTLTHMSKYLTTIKTVVCRT